MKVITSTDYKFRSFYELGVYKFITSITRNSGKKYDPHDNSI
jgi:hypothetical protein